MKREAGSRYAAGWHARETEMGIFGPVLLAAFAAAQSGPPGVAQIMARVAANQQSARDIRRSYVYRQEPLLRMHRASGKLAREERADYIVTPVKQGFEKRLSKFAGKYEFKGKYVPYDQPGYRYKDLDLDGDLMHSMAEDMLNDHKSPDGIGQDLFPLTAEEQKKYDFRLAGTETYRGRTVYRVAFQPRRDVPHGEDDPCWKGEALIDTEEYQPVLVTTSLAEKIPLAVKVLLGTDVKGLGFSVAYRKFAGVWFPVSYGGEFEVRGLFFYKRTISVAMQNSDFRKTDVTSTVVYATDAH
jgi:hypothetical protein